MEQSGRERGERGSATSPQTDSAYFRGMRRGRESGRGCYLGNQRGWLLSLYEVVTKGVTLKWYCVDGWEVLGCVCLGFSGMEYRGRWTKEGGDDEPMDCNEDDNG